MSITLTNTDTDLFDHAFDAEPCDIFQDDECQQRCPNVATHFLHTVCQCCRLPEFAHFCEEDYKRLMEGNILCTECEGYMIFLREI
jgi:hypothetical protein